MMAALEQSNAPRALAASRSSWRWRLLLLYLAGVLQTRAQPDKNGFISIDCGLQGPSYVDDTTNLSHEPDAAFTDAGENHNISPSKIEQGLPRSMLSLRSFPNGKRNCYTLRSLTAGNKYLLRASFKYGNYDGLLKPPVFDLHIGVNLWATVDTSGEGSPWWEWEAILVVPDDFVQVCLVNTGAGNPFISGLDLRPLKSSLYPQVNATQGLNLSSRRNFGPTTVRYPDDPYDRIWYRFGNTASWNITSTELRVEQGKTNDFEPPSKVMQTAVTPSVASDDIRFRWSLPPRPSDPSPRCMHILYFSELQVHRRKDDVREQYVYINGNLQNPKGFRPPYLVSDYIYSTKPFGGYDQNQFHVCIQATANSTLPPIINADEVYTTMPTTNIGTDSRDISAITAIKKQYGVINENWVGDPCGPSNLRWGGLTCSPDSTSSHPRITGVNVSFNGLKGDISPFFADLRAVQYMDLSHNNLTGSIPNTLSQLPSLKVLDLTGNQLSGSIPPGLIQKIQDGSLNLMYGNNPSLCTDGDSCPTTKRKTKLAIYIAAPLALAVVIVSVLVLFFLLRPKKKGRWSNNSVKPRNETSMSSVPIGDEHSSLQLENRRFTYKELARITNDFLHVIGRGGFGYVYNGLLEDGTQVAVKLRSESSNQGVKEFITEAQILTRIHHKNLVSMIGYCKDGEFLALVYEYLPEGSLQEHILGKHLTWRQRLRIALESAQGLEYLHKGCNPPLIHRDVKTSNILLNAKLEAKVGDFGLSKAFNLGTCSHVSMSNLVGTPGYVDPEYQVTMQPTTKSDVFSFGVVLLELITGKPAILRDPEPVGIIKWVQQRLARGEIESVMDARMTSDDHDVNSVWKTADVALKCTAQASAERPTMSDVVAQLQECLELEECGRAAAGGGGASLQSFYTGSNGDLSSSCNRNAYTAASASRRSAAAFEMVEMMATGPATR